MGSNDNPLNNTKDYYPNTKSASRGGLSDAMHKSPAKVEQQAGGPWGLDGPKADQQPRSSHAQYSKLQPASHSGNFMNVKGP